MFEKLIEHIDLIAIRNNITLEEKVLTEDDLIFERYIDELDYDIQNVNEVFSQEHKKDPLFKPVKDYSNGKWRKILSGISNLAIASMYGVAAAGTVSSFGTPAWMWAGIAVIFFAVNGTFGLLIKSLLLGTDNVVRRNPRMERLLSVAKYDKKVIDLIDEMKKELDTGKARKTKIKELKVKLNERFRELEVGINADRKESLKEDLFDDKPVSPEEMLAHTKEMEKAKKKSDKEYEKNRLVKGGENNGKKTK
jgi:hypothetical protein